MQRWAADAAAADPVEEEDGHKSQEWDKQLTGRQDLKANLRIGRLHGPYGEELVEEILLWQKDAAAARNLPTARSTPSIPKDRPSDPHSSGASGPATCRIDLSARRTLDFLTPRKETPTAERRPAAVHPNPVSSAIDGHDHALESWNADCLSGFDP